MTNNSFRYRPAWIVVGAVGVVIAVVGWGIGSRVSAEKALTRVTDAAAQPTVFAVAAAPGPAVEDLVLPGTVQAEYETPIYARTSGYIKRWYTDIGTRVKAGTLLAEIDSPEVDRQLLQAKADLKTAEANNVVAQATAKRVHALLPTQSVSAEQDDQATSDAAARAALVASAEANVERLSELVGFERVVAPYDGVVTARETDIGNLINAGSGTGPELFRVADTRKLRIYVQVPQSYAALIRPGVATELRFPEYPGRTFPAALVRTADAIEPRARTLLVELEADNGKGELFPGGYTDVQFTLPITERHVNVPANALLFRAEGLRIASVSKEGVVTLHKVTLGRDFGTTVEVTSGIEPGTMIVLNPPASVVDGERVSVRSGGSGRPGSRRS
ncbi:efflux RND transporter periplasmic adaptor subunit [Paraburkholderia solisilvae]|uniref:Multidrug resistance protein MdtA n=1 Tax=Paraburkholderia solisilvae TaxID=624376 RepID=A0A6J5DQS3_9BURK|nr:efflux RND transporter periplasmic adaptor subunit [Paraburkholderia solisilvae]CAB3756328.1 Multidrug resistance protein MdtA [Paraburkholderia solisilvae]